jgi:hypothetical protein
MGAPGETSFNCPAPESESPGTSLDQGEVARRVFIVGSSGEEARLTRRPGIRTPFTCREDLKRPSFRDVANDSRREKLLPIYIICMFRELVHRLSIDFFYIIIEDS